jgi:hypothetical protein
MRATQESRVVGDSQVSLHTKLLLLLFIIHTSEPQ